MLHLLKRLLVLGHLRLANACCARHLTSCVSLLSVAILSLPEGVFVTVYCSAGSVSASGTAVTVDVRNNNGGNTIASRTISVSEFRAANVPQNFTLDFTASSGGSYEFRVGPGGNVGILHVATHVAQVRDS